MPTYVNDADAPYWPEILLWLKKNQRKAARRARKRNR
jgi:hypothetical protein